MHDKCELQPFNAHATSRLWIADLSRSMPRVRSLPAPAGDHYCSARQAPWRSESNIRYSWVSERDSVTRRLIA